MADSEVDRVAGPVDVTVGTELAGESGQESRSLRVGRGHVRVALLGVEALLRLELVVGPLLESAVGDAAPRLARQVDARVRAEAPCPGHLDHGLDGLAGIFVRAVADPHVVAEAVENRVARDDERPPERQRPERLTVEVVENAVACRVGRGAVVAAVERIALLHGRRGRHDLERRAGSEQPLSRPAGERRAGRLAELGVELGLREALLEVGGGVVGIARHSSDAAGLGLKDDDRARRCAVVDEGLVAQVGRRPRVHDALLQRRLGDLLDVLVDRQDELGTGDGGGRSGRTGNGAVLVDEQPLEPVDAAQSLVVGLLNAGLADQRIGHGILVASVGAFVGDRAEVTQQVGGELAVRVLADRLVLRRDSRFSME